MSEGWTIAAEPMMGDAEPGHAHAEIDYQRALDLLMASLAVLALFPLMTIIALAVWLSDGGPVFFGHMRVGRMGRTFRCWKFRSMVTNSEQVLQDHLAGDPVALQEWQSDHKLRGDPRITRVGRLLRSSSLDELPQLWNVFAGEMSLVGPRPIVIAEIARYKSNFKDYCACRPGITGLWQISGRSNMSYEQRVDLDVRFVKSRSVWLYMHIILATIPAVLARRGAY